MVVMGYCRVYEAGGGVNSKVAETMLKATQSYGKGRSEQSLRPFFMPYGLAVADRKSWARVRRLAQDVGGGHKAVVP